MSYVDEVLERVVAKNPAEPEFHQAVKEVLESLRVVIEANEEKFRKDALLERLVEPERQFKFRVCFPEYPSAYLLVSTVPMVIITASETIFSDAISSRFLLCLDASAWIACPTSSSYWVIKSIT